MPDPFASEPEVSLHGLSPGTLRAIRLMAAAPAHSADAELVVEWGPNGGVKAAMIGLYSVRGRTVMSLLGHMAIRAGLGSGYATQYFTLYATWRAAAEARWGAPQPSDAWSRP